VSQANIKPNQESDAEVECWHLGSPGFTCQKRGEGKRGSLLRRGELEKKAAIKLCLVGAVNES